MYSTNCKLRSIARNSKSNNSWSTNNISPSISAPSAPTGVSVSVSTPSAVAAISVTAPTITTPTAPSDITVLAPVAPDGLHLQ